MIGIRESTAARRTPKSTSAMSATALRALRAVCMCLQRSTGFLRDSQSPLRADRTQRSRPLTRVPLVAPAWLARRSAAEKLLRKARRTQYLSLLRSGLLLLLLPPPPPPDDPLSSSLRRSPPRYPPSLPSLLSSYLPPSPLRPPSLSLARSRSRSRSRARESTSARSKTISPCPPRTWCEYRLEP